MSAPIAAELLKPFRRRRTRLPFLLPALSLCFLCFFFSPIGSHASDFGPATFIVGGDHDYPPYEYLDEEGNPTGYNVELSQAIAEVMGIKVEFRLDDWSKIRQDLENGKVDILQGMVASKARGQFYNFSPPHIFVHESVFARLKTATVSSLEDLQGKELIVQKNGFMHDYLREQKLDAIFIPVDTHAAALRLLASGKHDYALVGNLPGLYLGRELGLTNIKPVGNPFLGQPYAYATNKGNDELMAIFSEGLAILKNTGKQQEIYNRWLGPLELESGYWKKFLPLGAAVVGTLLLLLGGVSLWNRSLKKEVDRRTKELQQHQQQLIQADKMASLGTLVSGMAHEINNPNSLTLLNVPILKKSFKSIEGVLENHYHQHGDFEMGGLDYSEMREEIPHMLSETLSGAERIKRIVEDLKDFARQSDPSLVEDVDLNSVVQTALRLIENSLKKATNHFELNLAAGLPLIKGNSQRIEQVVVNLVMNACQALKNQEAGISVETFHDTGSDRVVCRVRDEGVGISAEDMRHLTDPFFTTKRETGGTGLGLSVSATIVQQHGGSLDFDSVQGQGATATLALPVHRKEHHQ